MPAKEQVVTDSTPMPKGYGFLKKGTLYLTANVRRKTHAANKTLFVVKDKSGVLGLRAPKWILHQVFDEEKATREKRKEKVQRRDKAGEKEFETSIRALFPKIPADDVQAVISRALKKRTGRVGRTTLLTVEERAKLAVLAHIRHRHTEYDTLIRDMGRNNARKTIEPKMKEVLAEWGASKKCRKPRAKKPKKLRALPTRNVKQERGPRKPTRSSARLNNTRDVSLEILEDFPDDKDDSRRRPDGTVAQGEDDSDEEYDYSLGDFINDDSDENILTCSEDEEDELEDDWDSE
ncbi:hypothetical protein B0T10DRAFT_216716 [Thelonectria olida]|uniref:DUF2293 domain-containing protein n=1 Tax=Thelonectria olida TaxID=1576542 RepID=A0A9P8WE70_9HYPO|nr:hypothetical protein B0T10DRAFT_216716 [Thelonectria olida]